jgi:hypothetical protein
MEGNLRRDTVEPMTIVAETRGGRLSSSEFEPGVYLTDGLRLFRVVRGFSWPAHESEAVLEDCRTLDHFSYAPDEVWALGLNVVRTERAAA